MACKRLTHHWSFVWRTQRSLVDTPHKGQKCGDFRISPLSGCKITVENSVEVPSMGDSIWIWPSGGPVVFSMQLTNTDKVENSLHSRFLQASLWCSLRIINAKYCYHTVTTQACAPIQRTVSCLGLLTHRGHSRYDKLLSCRRLETW